MKYIIAGFGKFGRLAFERLTAQFPNGELIVIDKRIDRSVPIGGRRISAIEGDAVQYLLNAPGLEADDFLIPMTPFHLAASYVQERRPGTAYVPVPPGLESITPNPVILNESNLCCTKSSVLCPDDCPEGDYCMVTGEPRTQPLYDMLARLSAPGYSMAVQRSFQALPGIGGFPLGDLWRIERGLPEGKILLATSCKCHGIVTALHVGRGVS
jgi:hypothetical protein